MTVTPKVRVDANDVGSVLADMMSGASGITAFAGGGQASATALTSTMNRVTTVASAGDSVKLPAALAGAMVAVKNTTATSCNVFPATGDAINALAANAALAVAATTLTIFFCGVDGTWDTK